MVQRDSYADASYDQKNTKKNVFNLWHNPLLKTAVGNEILFAADSMFHSKKEKFGQGDSSLRPSIHKKGKKRAHSYLLHNTVSEETCSV